MESLQYKSKLHINKHCNNIFITFIIHINAYICYLSITGSINIECLTISLEEAS